MSNTREYDVVLAPKGVRLSEASDVRFVPVTVDVPREDDRFPSRVETCVASQGPIDSWAFKNHWDVETVIRRDVTPVRRVKDALLQFDRPHNSWLNGYKPYKLYVDDPRVGARVGVKLALSPSVDEEVSTWMHDVKMSLSKSGADPRAWDIHDAMVAVAVAQNPDLVDDITATDGYGVQAFHDALVTEAIAHTQYVVGRV